MNNESKNSYNSKNNPGFSGTGPTGANKEFSFGYNTPFYTPTSGKYSVNGSISGSTSMGPNGLPGSATGGSVGIGFRF